MNAPLTHTQYSKAEPVDCPPIYFLPGTLCNENTFTAQNEYLSAKDIRCHTVDYGLSNTLESMSNTVLECMQHSPGILVAFSMGGMVAFEMLRSAPALVQGLVLISTNAHADSKDKAQLRQTHVQQAQNEGLAELISDTYMPNYLFTENADLQQRILNMALQLGANTFAAQAEVLAARPNSSASLKQITCPTLIVAGNNDVLCPPSEQQRMHKLIPHSELILIDDCGHFCTLEHAQKVNEAISEAIVAWLKHR